MTEIINGFDDFEEITPIETVEEVKGYSEEDISALVNEGMKREQVEKYLADGYSVEALKENALHHKLVDMLTVLRPDENYSWDDKGISELFSELFKDSCRFNATAREWYFYTGKVWKIDTGAMVVSQKAKVFSTALISYCALIDDERRRGEYLKRVSCYGQLRYRETLVKDSRDNYFITADDLDKNLDLYNCQNGTFNLSTWQFKPHDPADLLSKISNFEFKPLATSAEWDKFIDDIMCGNSQKKRFIQKLYGMTLTADTSAEQCYFEYGATTRNGKSTLNETIAFGHGGSGGYALTMSPQTLAQKQNRDSRAANGDIARLRGCRFLNVSEPPKRMLLDSALLKTLLGRDTIVARNLYEKEFEFTPIFKLFINTNHLPLIQDDTLFTSGRICVITFDRHFSEDEQDKGLKDRLKSRENLSGLFNWLLEGLALYRSEGLHAPQDVIEATSNYRQSADKIGNFIAECMEQTGKNSAAGTVYQHYSSWCDSNGYGVENKGNFFDELRSKGLLAPSGTVGKTTVRNVVKGYSLKYEETPYLDRPY